MANVASYSINISALRSVQKMAGSARDCAPFASPSEDSAFVMEGPGLTVGVGERVILSPDPSSSSISTTGGVEETTVGCKRSDGTGFGTSSHQFSLVVSVDRGCEAMIVYH